MRLCGSGKNKLLRPQNELFFGYPGRHLQLMRRIISAVTDPDDVVWEPFGGLASASVAAAETGRFPCVAEIDHDFAVLAAQRLNDAVAGRDPETEEPAR